MNGAADARVRWRQSFEGAAAAMSMGSVPINKAARFTGASDAYPKRGHTIRWCPGAGSNHRHRDFQSRALPTELPGLLMTGRPPAQATRPLTLALFAVHPAKRKALIGRRTGDAIAFTKPFQEVAILAAGAAEWRMFGARRLAAQRATLGLNGFRHRRRRWAEQRLRASRCLLRLDDRARPAIRRGPPG